MSIELPKLPEGECSEWLQHGKRVNAFPSNRRPMAEQSEYERAYWVPKGYDSAPLFTAGQMRAFGQEAARLALEEAAKAVRAQISTLSMHASARECTAYNDAVKDCDKAIRALAASGAGK